MTDRSAAEKCLSFVHVQVSPRQGAPQKELGMRPVVTVSRQTGSGGVAVAQAVADYVNARQPPKSVAWTVFDRNLVEKVLEDHELPRQLAAFMPEDKIPFLSDVVEELLGLHPLSWRLVQQTTETILRLANMGSCVLVGRGATLITQPMPNAFHVRLVGSLERRVARVRETQGLSPKAARAYVENEDAARRRYLKRYFKVNVEDPLLYHLVLNTDLVSLPEAARIVGDAVLARSA